MFNLFESFSRYVLWCKAGISNKNPAKIAGYFLSTVEHVKGMELKEVKEAYCMWILNMFLRLELNLFINNWVLLVCTVPVGTKIISTYDYSQLPASNMALHIARDRKSDNHSVFLITILFDSLISVKSIQ